MSMFVRNCMRHPAFALVILSGAASASARPDKPLEYYAIPLYINLYTNETNVNAAEVKRWVDAANTILAINHAPVRIQALKSLVNLRTVNLSNTGMTDTEIRRELDFGDSEIGPAPQSQTETTSRTRGKGLKVSVIGNKLLDNGDFPIDGPRNPDGISITLPGESDPRRTVFMKRNAVGEQKSAETLTHELLHALGLDDLRGESNRGRIMFYSGGRNGTVLSDAEIEKIKARAARYGTKIIKSRTTSANEPAEPAPDAYGFAAYAGPSPARDVSERSVTSATMQASDSDDYRLSLSLRGLTAPAPAPARDYLLLFNTDNSNATGSLLHGTPGVDWIVRAHHEGFGAFQATLESSDGMISMPLIAAESRLRLEADLPPGSDPDGPSTDFEDALGVEIPRGALSFTGGEFYDVPVITLDTAIGLVDSFTMPFDTALHTRGPQLRADKGTYETGEAMHLTGWGYEPFDTVDIALEGNPLAAIQADATGAFASDVAAPIWPTSDSFFFLTAEGLSMRFGGGKIGTTVVNPTPGTASLALIGLVALCRRRREARSDNRAQ